MTPGDHCRGVLHAAGAHPLDDGLDRRWATSFSPPSPSGRAASSASPSWLMLLIAAIGADAAEPGHHRLALRHGVSHPLQRPGQRLGSPQSCATTDLEASRWCSTGCIAKILRDHPAPSHRHHPVPRRHRRRPACSFLALLHPFKRASIANFRWAILLMWISAALGMAFFGISKDPLDPNQLHLLFAPIMTAYGLAFISILWSRLEFVASTPILRQCPSLRHRRHLRPAAGAVPAAESPARHCISATAAACRIGRPTTPPP